MSRNRSRRRDGNDGCLVSLFPLLIVLGIILGIIQFIAENIGIILIVVAIIGATIWLIVANHNSNKEKEKAEAEKQNNIAAINASETEPSLISVPSSSSFANKEEEFVNTSFRDFLKKKNDVLLAQSHFDYLSNKANALRTLGRNDEADQLGNEIRQARFALDSAQLDLGGSFTSIFNTFFYKSPEVRSSFASFINKLPDQQLPLICDFFRGPQIKAVSTGGSSALLFTPAYVMNYSGPSQTIKLVQYKDVNVSSCITTEILDGQKQSNDEIEHIGYRYETKDGYRDLRYSWDNNPTYTFVYRGTATIRCNGLSYEQRFSNKSLTEGFEKALNSYISLLTGKYKSVISQILDHNDELSMAGSVDTFMDQQFAAKKLKEAAAKAERDKQEKAMLEREVKAKAKLEEEQAEAIEKQRRAEFLNSVAIVDGTLTSWYGDDRDFVLPKGIASAIGTAFRWKNNLESVELPAGISSIQANAFHGSASLKRIILPDSVTEIGKEAFLGCSALCDVVLPGGIKTITEKMFGECSSMQSLTIPVGVKWIERGAFSGCSKLQELILPDGITVVDDDAFENCISLKKVVFPDSVNRIGKNIFNGCASLEHVVLGGGIKRIPEACFFNLKKLQDVMIASDIVEIGDRAFKNCQMLSRVLFVDAKKTATNKGMDFEALVSGKQPSKTEGFTMNSLERIGNAAFENCFSFTGLDLNYGLRYIGDRAFANCRSIKTVNLPKTITEFCKGVFSGCVALSTVSGVEDVDWHKKGCFIGTPWLSTQAENEFVIIDGYLEAYTGSDSSVLVPEGVTAIGCNSFDGNAHVSSVFVPEGVTSIDELAFANCLRLKSIQIADSVTHIEDNAFANDSGFVIQCSRGSTASSFRIRNKIAGEYIPKTRAVEATEQSNIRTRSNVANGLSGLSEDELRVVMEMRREKLAQKKVGEAKDVVLEKTDYILVPFDDSKVAIKLLSDNRKITNNIFNLRFIQIEPVSNTKAASEYETFVIDSIGQVISNIKEISADKSGDDLTYKVTYSLTAQEKLDKSSAYYVVLRYKGAGTNILSKTQYHINIDFTSDFD